MIEEVWKPVVGWECEYLISSWGRVLSLPRMTPGREGVMRRVPGKLLKPSAVRRRTAHLKVTLIRPGCRRYFQVHRLVLEAFVGPCPDGQEACHYNDIADDNRLENLRWDTPSANMSDRVRNGRDHNTKKTHCVNGHEFTPENTLIIGSKHRSCRACARARSNKRNPHDRAKRREYMREYHRRMRAEARAKRESAA